MPDMYGNGTMIAITYKVSDLIKTIDFYDILLGVPAAYRKNRAVYTVQDSLTLTFVQNVEAEYPLHGNFSLLVNSPADVNQRLLKFSNKCFTAITSDIDTSYKNDTVVVKDPNGITWEIALQTRPPYKFKLFNIPRLNSIWDILK